MIGGSLESLIPMTSQLTRPRVHTCMTSLPSIEQKTSQSTHFGWHVTNHISFDCMPYDIYHTHSFLCPNHAFHINSAPLYKFALLFWNTPGTCKKGLLLEIDLSDRIEIIEIDWMQQSEFTTVVDKLLGRLDNWTDRVTLGLVEKRCITIATTWFVRMYVSSYFVLIKFCSHSLFCSLWAG